MWLKKTFLGDEVPKENEHYTCIACITIGSVMRMEKKNYLQVYLQECKYRIKKTKLTKFIEAELESYFCNLDVRFNVRFYLRL